nr:FAD-dependent oxidoreductase [Actinomycetota bacterium]
MTTATRPDVVDSSAASREQIPPEAGWDLVVVGGGTAGIVGAKTAAQLGARVLLIERERPGGDCLWTGCVPSKALLAAAAAAANARTAGRFGVDVSEVRVDFARVMQHVHGAIAHIAPIDSPEALREAGVEVLTGEAVFTGASTVEVDGQSIAFRQALIATGAAPAVPPIPGLRETAYLTSETIWDLTELPDDLVVLGGGSIGVELGQAFARLGSSVTVVEGLPRIMSREDEYAAALVAAALADDGVRVLTGQPVARVESGAETGGTLVLADDTRVPFGRLVVAVGRSPRTSDLGLEPAGVEVGKGGYLTVDDHLRTTNKRIWAAGDLTGHPQFTHTAGVHGATA